MKLKALLFLLLVALLPLAAPRTAQARADVSFDYFYDALLPYGEWIEVEGYGDCWHPTDVDADWVPYSDGYLAFTDAGWTWVGYEEFAGIVYHYGRWLKVKAVGWCWVPDYEWGPAWLSWRTNDDYIGWAPLPPRAYWQPEIGISTWVDTVCDTGPDFYNFCRVRDFGAPVLRLVIINRTRNVTIIRNTVNITNITYNTYGDVPVIYNGGPSYAVISSRSERPIPVLKLVRHTHFEHEDFHGGPGRFSPNARTVGNQLIVNAPIVAPPEQPAFLKDKVKKVFGADKVANGWAGVTDGKVRDDLRQRFQRETKGLTPYTAPAKAVVAADLKMVPAQADPGAVSPVFTGQGGRGKGDRQPPAITGNPVVPGPPANAVIDTAKPMKDGSATVSPGAAQPVDPRGVARTERENGRGKNGDVNTPPAVTGGPLKPSNQDAVTNPVLTPPGQGNVIDPRAGKTGQPKMGRENAPNPVVVVPPDVPVTVPVAVEPREGRGPKPMKDAPVGGFHPPGVDPAAAQAQAAAEAARAAREQANIQQQKMDAEKLRGVQAEADKLRAEQERMARQRDAESGAAAVREKQAAAREQGNAQQQKMDSEKLRASQAEMEKVKAEQERLARQREADANAASMRQKQAADAAAENAGKEKMQAQQQKRAVQAEREKLQTDQERMNRQREADAKAAAAQQKQLEVQRQSDLQRQAEAAKQADLKRQQMEAQGQERQRQQQEQIAEQRKQQQLDQQRAAQEAAKQQAAERARAQQLEQQRAAQDAAKQQAVEQQHRAMDAQREQAARQQAEAQRAAQQQAAQAAQAAQQQAPRGDKEKDKDKDKGR